jgi:IclR family transcriptional regulator, acetate operon repressor
MSEHFETNREISRIDGDTPALRLFALLEIIAAKDAMLTLQGLVNETGLPKPTVHRMLQQLEAAGIVQREVDSRHFSSGERMRRLSENVLINSTTRGARHEVLRRLVDEVGESCNITALSGSEVLYLDRVETPAPLRFYLHSGSKVPSHCSASGKLFLSQMSAAQRKRLLAHVPLQAFTPKTLTSFEALDLELENIKRQRYALDDEEFLPGLFCIAVLVPNPNGKSNMGIAVQSPVMRVNRDKALSFLPALQRAAQALASINAEQGLDKAKEQDLPQHISG